MNPIAFTLGNFEIKWYSLFILTGVVIAYFLLYIEAKKFKINEDFIFNLFFYSLIIGIIGARIYYVIFNWEYFSKHLSEIWQVWQGGLAIHGGIIFGLIMIFIYCKKHRWRTGRIIDMIIPGLLIAQCIGRWGNFFNQEAYGAATTLEHLQSLHISKFIIDGMYINEIYYTPTFFYESIWCFIGFIVVLLYRRRKFCKVTNITSFYLVWYGIGRFFIESSRTDSLMLQGFKMAQLVSIIMIIIGIVLFIRSSMKTKYEDLYSDINNTGRIGA